MTNEAGVSYARHLQPGQRAELRLFHLSSGIDRLLLLSHDLLFEAPNWHPDGARLVVNGNGLLFTVDAIGGGGLAQVSSPGLPEANNDHLVSPDGRWHYTSTNDWHIYRLPWAGGTPERITSDKADERVFRHFLHGITPDGRTLAYVGTEMLDGDEWGRRALWTLDVDTGEERLVGDGFSPADGPDFSRDGDVLYFNSECASEREGHAQIFAFDLGTNALRQLTFDERVNWFPHPSPDGRSLLYISFPEGTVGHPADLPVIIRHLTLATGEVRDLVALPGGQGTMNVPNWSPDGSSFAYVAYPFA